MSGNYTVPGKGNRGFHPDAGRAAALARAACRFCGRRVRPCNLARHERAHRG